MRNMRISAAGWRVSAILAVTYVLVTLTCLLLIGFVTTGSWQAAFLGIRWITILGFEIDLLGVVIVGIVFTAVLVTGFTFFVSRRTPWSKTSEDGGRSEKTPYPLWAMRVLGICFILPALVLIAARWLAPAIFSTKTGHSAGAITLGTSDRITPVNMGHSINTAMREAEPSFTPDGRTMYFNCNNDDICITHLTGSWEEGNWSTPQVMGAPINTEYEEIEPLITPAGDKLYFNSNRPTGILRKLPFLSPLMDVFEVVNMIAFGSGISLFDGLGVGHVWVSTNVNGAWSEPQLLNAVSGEPPVNSAFHDHCLSFSADGNEAFWTSTRPGGFGGNDIWTSRRVNNRWTAPENLGPNVNGPGDEHHSVLSPDGKTLYVTSNRAGGFGGDDVYVTTRGVDGKWGALVNLGPLINGPGDDRCPAWTPDLKIFLFDTVRAGGNGARDLWWIYFKDVHGNSVSKSEGWLRQRN